MQTSPALHADPLSLMNLMKNRGTQSDDVGREVVGGIILEAEMFCFVSVEFGPQDKPLVTNLAWVLS